MAMLRGTGCTMPSLREQVEDLLPAWRSWYPSLFHAAEDLGLIRPRVCAPSTLLLSARHSGIRSDAIDAYRQKWGGTDEQRAPRAARPRSAARRGRRSR